MFVNVAGLGKRQVPVASDAGNRVRKDMMRSLLKRGEQTQQFIGFLARRDVDLDQLGAAERQGAGLVEDRGACCPS